MQVIYQSTDDELFDTETEALLNDALVDNDSGVYVERYTRRRIVKCIMENFNITPIIKPKDQCLANSLNNKDEE